MKSKNKEKVDVLFLGLVRKPDTFKKSVNDFLKLREQGLVNQIIFSTWDYEVEKNPEMIDFLKKNDVKIIASVEPKERGVGNIWCQMISLEKALDKVDDDRFVMKTRSDVYINPRFLRKLFSEKEKLLKITNHLPKGDIFKYKIWVHYYELKTPFHMGEESLFGNKHDMKHMVNYETLYDNIKVGDAVSHIRRFINPFIREYPILYKYLTKYSKDSWLKTFTIWFSHNIYEVRGSKLSRKVSSQNKFQRIHKKMKDDNFLDVLAAYYSIIHSHFYIDGNSFENQITGGPWSTAYSGINQKNFKANFSEEKSHPKNPGQVYVYDNELLGNICNKKLEKDELSERLMQAIDRFNS